jgi:hypothetical protein
VLVVNQGTRVTILLALVVGLLVINLGVPSPAGAVPPSYFGLRTDGNTILWFTSYYTDSYPCWTSIESPNTSQCVRDDDPASGYGRGDVSGDRLVWTKNFRLDGISLATGEPLALPASTSQGAMDVRPRMSGSRMVWLNRPGPAASWRILTVDLEVGGNPITVATLPATSTNDSFGVPNTWPVISGNLIIWGEEFLTPGEHEAESEIQWQLWSSRPGSDRTMLASEQSARIAGYDVVDSIAVYSADGRIVVVDVDGLLPNRTIERHGENPSTDGRYVFWQDLDRFNPVTGMYEEYIRGYDTWSDAYLGRVSQSNHWSFGAFARDDNVIWFHYPPDTSNPLIAVRQVQDILPTRAQPDPGKTDPAWLYFNKTGHYLSYGFKDFWLNSGGLPVFGYPLSREYDELNRDLREYRTVQYTERQRFEYHPAYAGTPYETLLGRLGAADAEERGLDIHPAFASVSKPTGPGIEYFDATGHTLRGPFRDYWHNHGLEFGDAGVSYRESLALFGYPISEEFVDSDTGLRTQYFERAVFEYHPDNPDPYKVLPRRLGAEEIDSREW